LVLHLATSKHLYFAQLIRQRRIHQTSPQGSPSSGLGATHARHIFATHHRPPRLIVTPADVMAIWTGRRPWKSIRGWRPRRGNSLRNNARRCLCIAPFSISVRN
jgi:hypothetical protein